MLSAEAADAEEREAAKRLQRAVEALARARQAVDALCALDTAQRGPQDIRRVVAGMVAVVPFLAPAVGLLANRATTERPAIGDAVQGARLSAELREYAGLLGSHFTAALARQQPFTPAERVSIERTRGRIDELRTLIELRVQLPGQEAEVLKAWQLAEDHYFGSAAQLLVQVIAAGESDGHYGMDPGEFARRYVPDMNTLFALRDVLLNRAQGIATDEGQRVRARLAAGAAILALMMALLLAGMRVLQRRVLAPLEGVTRALESLARNELDAPLPAPQACDEMAAVIDAVSRLQAGSRERLMLEAERQSLIAQLRSQSLTDYLTGLPNRRAFFESAEFELAVARRQGLPVVAVMLDIDHFKKFNDRHGHNVGDQALRQVAQTLQQVLRTGDLVGRFGGEEFVLLMMRCELAEGLACVERLQATLKDLRLNFPDGTQGGITASIGLADSTRYGLDVDALLSQADAAMYRAKALGRDQTVVAEETVPG
jgi:diguanylate cyclase (GGDEF)-like protein